MDLKTRKRVACELLIAADLLDNRVSAVKKIKRKKMTKSQRKKMQRQAAKRGDKMGRKIWVEVTQQPKKTRRGSYVGYATFNWQRDSEKAGHSVMVNVGEKPAKLQIKSRDLMVKPKGGEPFAWGSKSDKKDEKKSEDKKDGKKDEKDSPKGGAKPDNNDGKDKGDKKPDDKPKKKKKKETKEKKPDAEKAKDKAGSPKEDKPKEDKPKSKPKKPAKKKEPKEDKPLSEKDLAKSGPVKNALKMLADGDEQGFDAAKGVLKEVNKRLGTGSKLAEGIRKSVKKYKNEENFLKSAPVTNAFAALKKGGQDAAAIAQMTAQDVDSRLGPDNRVSKKLWDEIRKQTKKMKGYEDRIANSSPVKNVEKMLKESQKGSHSAVKELLVALEKRLGPDASLVKHFQGALADSRSKGGGSYEDYNSWKERLKAEDNWDEKTGQPKKD